MMPSGIVRTFCESEGYKEMLQWNWSPGLQKIKIRNINNSPPNSYTWASRIEDAFTTAYSQWLLGEAFDTCEREA